MKASARLEVVRRCGRDVLVDVRSEPPLTVRSTGDRVLLVGSAAGPVGGDELRLDVAVGPGARLSLGSVAATMAWPGPTGAPSVQHVHVTVADGGQLCWIPEPLVAVSGCRHHASTTVVLAADATAWIVDEVALGRTGEPPGSLEMSWRIERAGRPLVHHAEHLGPDVPGWGSAVTTGAYRHLLAAFAVGGVAPVTDPIVGTDVAAAVLPVADDAWVLLAAGVDRVAAQRACARVLSFDSGRIGPEPKDTTGHAGSRTS